MKHLLFAAIALSITITSFAQTKYTKISGKVTDAENGAPVIGASIVVTDLKTGVNTDVEGTFFLQLEKGKKYTVQISSVGYREKTVNDLSVAEGENSSLNILLEKNSAQLTSVVVTASAARRESVSSLYAAQKNGSAISDAISAEVIRKSPDRNTSEVLRRVSGTAIQDNKFVVIRGLSERYNTSLLNNAILPSTEPDKKAFSFDIIPSSLIDNVTIYKSPTPDLPGDFAGGAIKISTRDYPAHQLSDLSFNIGYNTQTTFKNFYKGAPDGKLDWLGFFDNSRLIPGSYYQYRGSAYSNLDDGLKQAITKQFSNTYSYAAAFQSRPNLSLSYTGGNTKLLGNHKLGYIYSLSYNTGRRVAERTRDEYETYDFHNYQYSTTSYDMRSTLSALLNITYSYGKSKISLKNLYNNDFVKTLSLRTGQNTVNPNEPFNYKSVNLEATSNGIENSVLEGLHSLSNRWTIDWNASYGTTYRWQPDQRILTFVSNPSNGNYFLKLNNQNSPVITDAGRIYSFLRENIYGVNLNVTKQFNWHGEIQKLKLGTANYYRDRSVEVDALGLATTKGTGVSIPETKTSSFATVLTPENIDTYGMVYGDIPASSTDYTGTGLLNSGYALLDNKFSDRIKLTWGVRIEKYRQELQTANRKNTVLDNTDVLPSLLFTYAATNKANIRVAGSQGVNRPEFRELADYRVYDYENDYIVSGNPGLQRGKNTNADLRYEWFPAAGEIISASVFYKYFKDPIEQTNLGNNILSYANADKATVYGVEAELRKRLSFINNDFFDRLTFYTNASYIKGSVTFDTVTVNSPLQGQSPYLVNAGLSYSSSNDNFSFNVLYNKIGPRLKFRAINTGGRNIFEKSRDMLDVQLSKKWLNNRLETKLTISDIFAQPYTWYYKYEAAPSSTNYNAAKDRIANSYKFGSTISIGVRYSFAK